MIPKFMRDAYPNDAIEETFLLTTWGEAWKRDAEGHMKGGKMSFIFPHVGDVLMDPPILGLTLKREPGAAVEFPAERVIDQIQFEIGGTMCERIPGSYLRLHDHLHNKDERLSDVLQNFDDGKDTKTFYVRLPLWFAAEGGLDIWAMHKHEAKVTVTFNDLASVPGLDPTFFPKPRVWAEYRSGKGITNRPEGAIRDTFDTVQFTGTDHVSPDHGRIRLMFNNATKYIAFVVRPKDPSKRVEVTHVSLEASNIPLRPEFPPDYYTRELPAREFDTILPENHFVYSLANRTSDGPDLSRIDDLALVLGVDAESFVDVFALSQFEYEISDGCFKMVETL